MSPMKQFQVTSMTDPFEQTNVYFTSTLLVEYRLHSGQWARLEVYEMPGGSGAIINVAFLRPPLISSISVAIPRMPPGWPKSQLVLAAQALLEPFRCLGRNGRV